MEHDEALNIKLYWKDSQILYIISYFIQLQNIANQEKGCYFILLLADAKEEPIPQI